MLEITRAVKQQINPQIEFYTSFKYKHWLRNEILLPKQIKKAKEPQKQSIFEENTNHLWKHYFHLKKIDAAMQLV